MAVRDGARERGKTGNVQAKEERIEWFRVLPAERENSGKLQPGFSELTSQPGPDFWASTKVSVLSDFNKNPTKSVYPESHTVDI